MIRLVKLFGIQVYIHYSWFLAFFLFTYLIATLTSGIANLFESNGTLWLVAFSALLVMSLFLCVLIHEYAHSLMSKFFKQPVERIVLFALGGQSVFKHEPRKAHQEFLIAIVGPLTNLAIAGIIWVSLLSVGSLEQLPTAERIVVQFFSMLQIWNIGLAIFNMVPSFPLDGGRVIKSLVWLITKNEGKSIKFAGLTGRTLSATLMFVMAAYAVINFFNANLLIDLGIHINGRSILSTFNAIWLIIIGYFLWSSSGYYLLANKAKVTKGGPESERTIIVPAYDPPVYKVMERIASTVQPSTTIEKLISNYFDYEGTTAKVVVEGNETLGIISERDVQKLDISKRTVDTVRQHMLPSPFPKLSLSDPVSKAAKLLSQARKQYAFVYSLDKLVGFIDFEEIYKLLMGAEKFSSTGDGQTGNTNK